MSKRPFQIAGEVLYQTDGMQHVMSIDYMHQLVHEGDLYAGGVYWTISNAGTALTTYYAGTVMPHGFFEIAVGGNTKFTMYEGGTLTGGSATGIINRKRSSANTSLGSMTYSGTLTGGTIIAMEFIPGGSKNFSSGGNTRSDHEVIGLTNTIYTVELVNISGDSINASVAFNFYEENV